MSAGTELPGQKADATSLAHRLSVLEMTIAAVAARLPPDDRAEIAAMLVFVAKGSDAAAAVSVACDNGDVQGRSFGEYAVDMLERIEHSRKSGLT